MHLKVLNTAVRSCHSLNGHFRIGYKNIPVSIDDAPKAVQGERNVVTTISARSAQRI
jgi:hypothetical protein